MLIIDLLKQSKELYLQEIEGKDYIRFPGMCWCIKTIANKGKSRIEQNNKGHVPYKIIKAQIPEFSPTYLKSYKVEYFASRPYLQIGLEFWWDVDDTESRIKAFDKLIELYENSTKEFVW